VREWSTAGILLSLIDGPLNSVQTL